MRTTITALVLSNLALCLSAIAHPGASITWSTPANITGDADVSTNGTTVYAYDWANNTEVVNGVTFNGTTNADVGTNIGIAGDNIGDNNATAFKSTSAPFSGLSTAYKGILTGAALAAGSNTLFTVTLSNLMVGEVYYVQMWVSDPRGAPTDTRTETNDGGGNIVVLDYSANQVAGSPGQYTIGSFTASDTSQSFTLEGAASTQLNALQVRDLGKPASVTFAGTQYDLGSAWRTSTTIKPLDVDGDNVLGSDGYNVVNLDAVQPSYLDTNVILSSTYNGNSGYAYIDYPPNPSSFFLSGTMNPDPGTSNSADLFYFSLNSNAIGRRIRVSLMVDNLDGQDFNAYSLSLSQTNRNLAGSGTVETTNALFNDRVPDWIFLDILNGAAGDGFLIQGIGGNNGTVTLGGVAFDSIPVGPPLPTTVAATNVYATTATLNAVVNPDGYATGVYFEYGTTTNYGSFTATNIYPIGAATLSISSALTNLTPGTTYYYQVVAVNDVGTVDGGQLSFTNGALLDVTNNADDGSPGTLRTLVANSASNDTIIFDPSLSGSNILLTDGSITVTNNITIDASSLPNGMTIDGNASDRIFQVDPGATLVLDSLTMTNGYAYDASGGGIINEGSLTLNLCTLSSNLAYAGNGGAIYNSGTLNLNQSTLSGNLAFDGSGGGIENDGGFVTLTASTLSENSATNYNGGGINNENGGTVALNQCTLSSNSAYGSSGGGGILNVGTMTINQCTIAGNDAVGSFGGGIFNNGTLAVTNSIIAGNQADDGGPDICQVYVLRYGGSNIVQFVDNFDTITGTTPIAADPGLNPLGNNGGPTQTMLPMAGSPAVDAGSDSATNIFATDQRGFPRLSAPHVDIGAVELQQATGTTLAATDVTGTNALGNGTITPNDLQTTWYFQYGTTLYYGNNSSGGSLPPGSSPVTVSNTLDNLTPATTYHFQMVVNDGVSDKYGADQTFTTPNTAPNGVTDAPYAYATTAILNASINPDGLATQYYFEYGPTTNYGFFSPTNTLLAGNLPVNVSFVLTNLPTNSDFYYEIVSSNSLGTNNGDQVQFTTGEFVVVTSSADDGGSGTLRYIATNAVSSSTIIFTNTLSGATIVLTNGEIELDGDLAIDASALASGITISGNTNSRIFNIDGSVLLNSLIITRGLANGISGGAVLISGELTANNCTWTGNNNTNDSGGSLYNNGTMTLNNCSVSGNIATYGAGGFQNNGQAALNQCTISSNVALLGEGGAFYNLGNMTLNQCTLSGNTANDGGVCFNIGHLTLNQCTLSGNTSVEVGGIHNFGGGALALNQCTVSGNSTPDGNAGGILNDSSSTITITNSIVAGNTASSSGSDINNSSTLAYGGSNIVQFVDNSEGTIAGATPIAASPHLATLGNYGGPTRTMLPMSNSPAIDAGDDSAANTFATDQRGFPRFSGQHVDIGAVEVQQLTVATSPASAITGTSVTENGAVTPGDLQIRWYFEFGTNTSYGSTSAANTVAPGFGPVDVSNALVNLAPATTYHFQLFATDGVRTGSGGDTSFTTSDTAPSVVTYGASGVTTNGATLNATVDPNGDDTGYYFQYGLTTNYGFFTGTNLIPAGNTVSNVSIAIASLTPNATYYFRVVATNTLGTNTGLPANFTTTALVPVAVTDPATGIAAGTATLNATINPGYASTAWYFQYGPTTNYGLFTSTNILAAGSSPVAVSNVITGLLPGTNYYFAIVAVNSAGTGAGQQAGFSTPTIPPIVTTEPATGVGVTVATANASINPGGAATAWYFKYGATTNYGLFTTTNNLPVGSFPVSVNDLLTNLAPGAAYHYQAVAMNSVGTSAGADLTFTNLKAPIVIIDSQILVAITSPANNFSTTASNVVVKGTIKGGAASPLLQVIVNNNAPVIATDGAAAHGAIPWTCTVPLTLGSNVITAETIYTNGTAIVSAPAVISVFYVSNLPAASSKSALTLTVSPAGSGKISGESSGASLELNKGYTVKAAPAKNWIFTNWTAGTDSNTVLGTNASLSFAMTPGLALQANFVPSPFTAAVTGSYNGLFSPDSGITEESSGFFSATVAAAGTGAYSAKLLLDGGTYSFTGSFDLSGDSEVTVARTGQPPVEVLLHLNLDQSTPDNQMTGSVINFASGGWTSTLLADRAVFSKTNTTADYAGKYTLIIPPGSGAPTTSPGGYSYATLTGTSAGVVTLSGNLADKSTFTQSVPVSEDGNIPLYASLYSKKGSFQGWLTMTNETTNQVSPVQMIEAADLAWLKPAIAKTVYPSGFSNTDLTAAGSLYTGGFSLSDGTLTISGGGLSSNLVFGGVSIAGTKLTSTNTEIKGALTTGTGVLTLTYTPKDGSKISAKGVVLQDNTGTNAAGWFLGTDDSGFFLLQP